LIPSHPKATASWAGFQLSNPNLDATQPLLNLAKLIPSQIRLSSWILLSS